MTTARDHFRGIVALLAGLALLPAGCVKRTETIKILPDGTVIRDERDVRRIDKAQLLHGHVEPLVGERPAAGTN